MLAGTSHPVPFGTSTSFCFSCTASCDGGRGASGVDPCGGAGGSRPTPSPSGCVCRCPGRCPGRCRTKYEPSGVHRHLQLLLLLHLSLSLSLSVHAPRCPPLARARLQAARATCSRTRTRVFWPVGLRLGRCLCGRWVGARGLARAQAKREVATRRSAVEMESVCGHCSSNQPSSHRYLSPKHSPMARHRSHATRTCPPPPRTSR